MRNVFAVAMLCLFSLSLAAGQSAISVEDQIKKLEQDWPQATINVRLRFVTVLDGVRLPSGQVPDHDTRFTIESCDTRLFTVK
jgi:hypothetical protein